MRSYLVVGPLILAAVSFAAPAAAQMSEQEMARMAQRQVIEQFDRDDDGRVSREEFAQSEPGAAGSELAAFDSDGDGKVTQDEYIARHRQQLEQRFTELDRNEDGALDETDISLVREEAFGQLDADGDGYISTAEVPLRHGPGMPQD